LLQPRPGLAQGLLRRGIERASPIVRPGLHGLKDKHSGALGLVGRIGNIIVDEVGNDGPNMAAPPALEAIFQLLGWDALRQEGEQRLMLSGQHSRDQVPGLWRFFWAGMHGVVNDGC